MTQADIGIMISWVSSSHDAIQAECAQQAAILCGTNEPPLTREEDFKCPIPRRYPWTERFHRYHTTPDRRLRNRKVQRPSTAACRRFRLNHFNASNRVSFSVEKRSIHSGPCVVFTRSVDAKSTTHVFGATFEGRRCSPMNHGDHGDCFTRHSNHSYCRTARKTRWADG